jgi:DNA-directed RNA polymerase subunit RPC12/RpoP
MTKSNYFLKVTIYNYRSAIMECDDDLSKLDSDQLEELVNELDENDEIEWKVDFSSQRRVPEEIESNSGDKYSIVFNDSKVRLDCFTCPTILYVGSEDYVKNKEYKCPKCSTTLELVVSKSNTESNNFMLMRG